MKKKRLLVNSVMMGLILLLSLCGCADDTAKNAGYRGAEYVEYKDWSASQQREMLDSISQTYNREIGLRNKLINNHLKNQDSDIELMNERYSYGQNTTKQRFLQH